MNRLEKILLLLMAIVLIAGFIDVASAQEQQTLGTFLKDSCIQLKQTCGNCTYVNITRVSAPDSSVLISGNFSMTRQDTIYNLTFCSTTQVGEYIVDWKANPDGVTSAGNYNFFISLTGIRPSTAQGTIYFFLGLLSIAIFGLSLFGAIKIKWKHPRDHKGIIVGLNDLKYVKLFLWFFTYLMFIFIAFSFKQVSRIADWEVAGNWFNYLFLILISFLFPVFVLTLVVAFISIADSKKLKNFMKRGIKVR